MTENENNLDLKKRYLKKLKAEYDKNYRSENIDTIKLKARIYYQKNKDIIKLTQKNYYDKNKHKKKEYVLKRSKTLKYRLMRKAKDARRYCKSGWLSAKKVQKVYEDNISKNGVLTCVLCNKIIVLGDDSLEHLLPVSRGGTNEYCNLGVAHKSCNYSKQDKTIEEWRRDMCSKEGEGMMRDSEERLKDHMKDHVDAENWELLIEMAWTFLKRQGLEKLNLK